jgi:hypothetical protein
MNVPPRRLVLIRRHWEVLVLCGVVVVLAFLLRVRPDDRVVLSALPEHPLPPTCLSYAWFGVKCPGCGLTRSVVHLAHGNLVDSWKAHRLGWLLAATILLQFPYRCLCLAWGGRPFFGPLLPRLYGHLLIALLLGNWLWHMIGHAVPLSN